MRSVSKSFGDNEVIHSVDLQVEDNEFMVFVGPSGCGKSTLLRLIAGLEDVNEGEISIGGERVEHLPPAKRGIAMVFQSYALYPHMTVFENMSFGLRLAKAKKDFIQQRVQEAADVLQLPNCSNANLRNFQEVNAKGSPSAGRLFVNPKFFFLMNRFRTWMPNSGCKCVLS